MLNELPDVPPAVTLLLGALAQSSSWVDARRSIRSLLKDLREQSTAYQAQYSSNTSSKASPRAFDVHLHGGLDLFDGSGACSDLACRLAAADRLCRSIGLIADHVWLTDLITEKFVNFGRATNDKLDRIVADAFVLSRLSPLINSGIIKFRSPWRAVCESCLESFEEQVRLLAYDVAKDFKKEAKFRSRAGGNYVLDTGNYFDPPLIYRNILPVARLPTLRDATDAIIYKQIRSAIWTGHDAALARGSILSNSRIGLAGLLHQEGRLNGTGGIMLLDSERSVTIPWVSELEPAQIVQLREEASEALPLFREMIAKTLTVKDNFDFDGKKTLDRIADLREQAEVVRAELSTTRKHSARFWKTTYGLLGFGLSAYGVASDQILPGVAGLLPLIQLLITHKTGHEKDMDKLTFRPGYVLVKAQDILAHAPAR